MENNMKMHKHPQDSSNVAEYLLQVLKEKGKPPTSTLGIIKLVYLCHGWMLGLYGRPMLNEPVEAWRYGPVVPSVYERYKHLRGANIPVSDTQVGEEVFDEDQKSVIQQVADIYGDFTPWQLSSITHKNGTPWLEVYNEGKGLFDVIPDEKIQAYYINKLNQANAG